MGYSSGSETVYCFSDAPAVTNPASLWTYTYSAPGTGSHSGDGYGSKSTPAVDGNYIYTLSCDGILNCLDKTSGALRWSATNNLANTYEWGTPGSPLIEGNLVIVNAYGHGLAYDKMTGNIAWGTNDSNAAGCASPFAVTIGTQRTVVIMANWWDLNCSRANKNVMRISGVDPLNGNVLWWAASDDSMGDSGIADPIIYNGIIRYSCTHIKTVYGYNLGSQPSGQRGEAWRANSMENVNTPVLLNGYIYALDLVSGLPPPQTGLLKCENPADGSVKWSSTESYSDNISGGASGAIMVAGGELVLLSAKGWLSVVDATPAGYTVMHSNAQVNTDYNLSFPFAIPPTIANGIMYVRGTYSTLTAYQVGSGSGGSAPVITSALSASGTVGQAFSYQITASGNTPMSYAANGLPPGLNLNTGTGAITGTPTTNGVTSASISAINAYGTNTVSLAVTINAAGSGTAPVITSALAASGTVGQTFSYQITASGNTPMSYAANGLPPGLNLNTGTGAITGTPTTNGVTGASISAINAYGTNAITLTITINAPPVVGAAAYQINCGGTNVPPFTVDNGVGYYVSGGSPWTIAANVDLGGVGSPAPMAVYQSARYTDNLGYIFSNLTAGVKYKLRLHFADIFNITVGPRVFDIVVLHGTQVVSNFDLTATAGGANKAVVREFTVVADSNGQVDIWLHAAAGNTCAINGIELLASAGPLITITPKVGDQVQLSWSSDSGTTYAVYKTTNLLGGWPSQPCTSFVGDGSTRTFSESMATQKIVFYRIKAGQ
jgi:hypothetical protein